MKAYFDYAATTPIDPRVLRAMTPFLKKEFGNASSIHQLGQNARIAIDQAREKIAQFLNCQIQEIIFTGSATEANNLAIFGSTKRIIKDQPINPHIITTEIEHHSVLHPIEKLRTDGVKATFISPQKNGIVDPKDFKKALTKNTVLVSVIYANNEIGAIQPLKEIAGIINGFKQSQKSKFPVFHTDAVQAINYLDCDVKKLGVDLLTLSGHKICGPKGIGALFVKKDAPIEALIFGGGHEFGLRSGTENVPGIVGLGEAIEMIKGHKKDLNKIIDFRDRIIESLLKVRGAEISGGIENRLPNNINISFAGVEGESLLMALDQEGIFVSTGSACSSKDLKPSHVLQALGLSPNRAHGSLRITLGRYTTKKEVDYLLKKLPVIVEKIRAISPFKI